VAFQLQVAWMMFTEFFFTIRKSTRAFARAPILSLALLFTIALGVGSNASIYGFVQGLTHPGYSLEYANRIVSIFKQDRFRAVGPLSRNEFQLLEQPVDAFDWIEAARVTPSDITINDRSEIVTVAAVMPNLAAALKVPLGNGVVLSYRIWQSDFDGRTDAIGNHVRIDNVDYPITGVAPNGLEGLYRDGPTDVWMPLQAASLKAVDGSARDLWVFAGLRRAVSTGRAEAAVHLKLGDSVTVSVIPFTGTPPRMAQGLSRVVRLLNFAAGAVFFIACINVGSLLLGRALRRSGETSLRVALGATRAKLGGELLSDSIVISLAGGALGMLLAVWSEHAIPALLFQQDAEHLVFAPRLLPIVAASLLCVSVTVLCGIVPVFATSTDRPWTVLRRESGLPSGTVQRVRTGMAVGQIAMCCMLVTCAVLVTESFHSALETAAGKRLGDPILLTVQAPADPDVDTRYFTKIEQKARSTATLSPPAWAARLPGDQPTWRSFRIQPSASDYREVALDIDWLTPETLDLIDTQPTAGRLFSLRDQARKVAVVDEEAAALLFGRETVGTVIQDPAGLPTEIIGVVRRSATSPLDRQRPTIYYNGGGPSVAPERVSRARFLVPNVSPSTQIVLNVNVVSQSYFDELGLPLIAGQEFSNRQLAGEDRVAVINQEAAALYFSRSPLGAGLIDDYGVRTAVIGVVGSHLLGAFQRQEEPTIYLPMWQDPLPRMTLILEGSKWNDRIVTDLRRGIESIPGPKVAPVVIKTLDMQLAQSGLAPLRIATLILGASASTALVLSFLGLLSVQSDAERQRRRELALHMAFGAQRWQIAFAVFKRAARLASVGTLIGMLGSLALLHVVVQDTVISSPPFWRWLIAALSPALAVMSAAVLPAYRASTVNPITFMGDDR
jgi:ABC-type lipoprotein release transport system permease subunit